MPYIHFTEEQKLRASEVDLVEFLRHQGEKPRKEFALPSAGREMRRMYTYLLKHRFLDRNIINAFVRAGLLYENYLTENGMDNTFKEFLLYSEEANDYGNGQEITIPSSLLQQANISPDSDIQIICLDGVLIIVTDSKLSLSGLAAVLGGYLQPLILQRLSLLT